MKAMASVVGVIGQETAVIRVAGKHYGTGQDCRRECCQLSELMRAVI